MVANFFQNARPSFNLQLRYALRSLQTGERLAAVIQNTFKLDALHGSIHSGLRGA